MSYTPDPYDDTQPQGATVRAKDAAPEFRAIKTALKALKTAVTETLPNALTALTTRVGNLETAQDALTVRTRVQLTGSGNFTVPAGVTTLWVTAVGGHRPVGTWGIVGATLYYNYTRSGGIAPTLRKKLTVTPAQVIAYALGANEVLASTGVGQYPAVISQVSAATATTFGDLVAPAASVEHKLSVVNTISHAITGGGNEQLLHSTPTNVDTFDSDVSMRTNFKLPISVSYSPPDNNMAVPVDFAPLLTVEY